MLDMMSFAAQLLPAAALTFPDVSPALVSIDLGFLGLGKFHSAGTRWDTWTESPWPGGTPRP
jgi:hypothetical protein